MSEEMSGELCPLCQTPLVPGLQRWHRVCPRCAYEKADLSPAINTQAGHRLINEQARETGLRALRLANFATLLQALRSLKPGGGRLLDVGCAHGWFLDLARHDFDVLGLEPDRFVFEATARRGLPVRRGYFPQALDTGESFDVISFNDVFEHIPDSQRVLDACRERLRDGGLLVLNLPSSSGIFYRLAKLFSRFGHPAFFERLWQKDLPSPHLHYFRHSNLVALLARNSFDLQASGTLPTLRLAGLYTRVSYTGKLGLMARIFICSGVALMLPLLKVLPGDIVYVVAKKKP